MSALPTRRRFYKEAAAQAVEGGHAVTLDGKPMRTPAGLPLVVPTEALAQAIAAEWAAVPQDGEIDPRPMIMMRFVATGLDRVAAQRQAVIDEMVGYGGSDLLCYRALDPMELVSRQREGWQPWLDWAARTLDAPLVVAQGVMPVAQPETSLAELRRAVGAYDDLTLSGMHHLTAALGSLVLALAVTAGLLAAEKAAELADLDADFQARRWGEDEEATARRRRLRQDILAAAGYLRLLGAIH